MPVMFVEFATPCECKNLFLADVSPLTLGDKNIITLVKHLDNTNTITMVAREGGHIFIVLKKLNVRSRVRRATLGIR